MCSYVVSLREVSVSGQRSRGAHCGMPSSAHWTNSSSPGPCVPPLLTLTSQWEGLYSPLCFCGLFVGLPLHLPVATTTTPGVKIILHPGLSLGTVLGHLVPSWGWHWKAQHRQKLHSTFLVHQGQVFLSSFGLITCITLELRQEVLQEHSWKGRERKGWSTSESCSCRGQELPLVF